MQDSNREHFSIISANVRGLQTNIGDLIRSQVIPHSPDVVATIEAFLNETISNNYGLIQGYTRWYRRDRLRGSFGGIAVCFRKNFLVQPLEVTLPNHLEIMFFKIFTKRHGSTPSVSATVLSGKVMSLCSSCVTTWTGYFKSSPAITPSLWVI